MSAARSTAADVYSEKSLAARIAPKNAVLIEATMRSATTRQYCFGSRKQA
jgi:hypothetical protein